MRFPILAAFAATALMISVPAWAQAPAAAPGAAPAMDKAARSKACSAEADQKGLRGKPRKRFRSACRRRRAG